MLEFSPGEYRILSDPLSSHGSALPWANVPLIRPLWLLLTLLFLAASFMFFVMSRERETLVAVDNYEIKVTSQHQQVQAILRDAGITTAPEDSVNPPLESNLTDGQEIIIHRALPVSIAVDGSSQDHRTQREAWADILDEVGVTYSPDDTLYVDGQMAAFDDSVQQLHQSRQDSPEGLRVPVSQDSRGNLTARGGSRPDQVPAINSEDPVNVIVKRAVTIYIHDDNILLTVPTTEDTLGQALKARGISLLQNDIISDPVDSEIKSGKHYYIKRAKPVTIKVDGKVINHRTQLDNVGEALKEAKVSVSPIDRIEPPASTKVENNLAVQVIRIKEDVITETESIDYSTRYQGDPGLEIDNQYVSQQGSNGILAKSYRVTYENGIETNRIKQKEWVEKPVQDKIISYGTKIVVRQLETPSGPVNYWRKLRFYATSYSPRDAGKPKSSSGYGRTALGLVAAHGVMAVDPGVIPFYTKVYVPGYGVAMAGDTGGGVRGFMIDLAFADDEPNYWSARYVDVYFLTPIPPASQIQWMFK